MSSPTRMLVLALSAAVLSAAFAAGAPAYAADPYAAPVLSTPDTTIAGHVTGSVTTDAPFVRIDLIGWNDLDTITSTVVPIAASTTYDFETWGWSKVRVRATACAAMDDCPGQITISSVISTSTVAPEVTWPTDTTIGTDNPDYTIDIADTGGGFLQIQWKNITIATIPQNGSIDLKPSLFDGSGNLVIVRCSSTYAGACTSTGVTRSIRVWTTFTPTVYSGSGTVSPDATSAPDAFLEYSLGISGAAVTFDYTLRRFGTSDVARTGSVPATENGLYHDVAIDVTGLPDASYELDGTFSFVAPDYGTVSGQVLNPPYVVVDATAPVIQSIAFDRSTVFPPTDGYQDSVAFRVTGDGTDTSIASARYDILDTNGDIVWTTQRTPPSPGLDGEGGTWMPGPVPAGNYVVRATVVDSAGNTAVATSAPVAVMQKKLTWVSTSQTVTTKASLVSRTVGRCSTVRSPSLHGWSGSLGLYSGTKCRPRGAAGTITTIHRLRLPSAFNYGSARIVLNGAAAHTRPTSAATFGWRLSSGSWASSTTARAANGAHPGASQAISTLKTAANDLYWRVRVTGGNRYDVRTFTITYDYLTLR